MQANILPFYKNSTPGWDQKVKTFFLKVMLNIILKLRSVEHYAIKMFDLMHTTDLMVRVKRSDIEIVQISIF